jgi:CheY-like chemotaxis protein
MGIARRILLVTDDSAVARTLDEAFSGKGIGVVAVPTGEDALWQLENDGFDAILTDLVLRGMSGHELEEEVRERQPGLPVFIVAGGRASTEMLAAIADRVLSSAAPAVAAAQPQAVARSGSRLRDVVLFLLGPLVALGYVVAFPVVGLGMLVYSAFEAKPAAEEAEPPPAAASPKTSLLKAFGMMLAIAAVGVFYGLVAPFMGIVLVVWFGLEAWGKVGVRAIGSGRS